MLATGSHPAHSPAGPLGGAVSLEQMMALAAQVERQQRAPAGPGHSAGPRSAALLSPEEWAWLFPACTGLGTPRA